MKYRDPLTGEVRYGNMPFDPEASGALAMQRAAKEDALSSKLLYAEREALQFKTAGLLAKDAYNKEIMKSKIVQDIKKPVNSLLVFIAAYLIFKGS